MATKQTIQQLLRGIDQDFDNTKPNKIKLVRHADNRTSWANADNKKLRIGGSAFPSSITNLHSLYEYKRDYFEKYQSEQAKGTFKNIEYIVSFLGEQHTTARFIGVYKICGRKQSPYAQGEEILDLKRLNQFSHLEETIIIEWGKATNSWHQYYKKDKEVIQIVDKLKVSDSIPPFKSYLDTILKFDQLKMVINQPSWVTELREKNCIYAIVDNSSPQIYIGSTYNRQGIYGRWIEYAQTGHGKDVDLRRIMKNNPTYAKDHLHWTILEVLPIDVTQAIATDREKLWKKKLLTNRFGYNNN